MDLHDYSLSRFNHTKQEDREVVSKAQAEGHKNPSGRQVLVANACLTPQQTAKRRIRETCPTLVVPSSSMRAPGPPKAVPARSAKSKADEKKKKETSSDPAATQARDSDEEMDSTVEGDQR